MGQQRISADEFARRVAHRLGAANESLRQEIGALWAKNAADGSLESGGTVKASARLTEEVGRALSVDLLNDYEAAKREHVDRELLDIAHTAAVQFTLGAFALWKLEKLNIPESAQRAGERLLEPIRAEVAEIFRRHAAGLPVDGVTEKPVVSVPEPLWGGLERWAKANPALTALVGFLAGVAATILAALIGRSHS